MHSKVILGGFFCLAGLLGSSCAGGLSRKVETNHELPKELSKELKEKFEVKDEAALSPSSNEEASVPVELKVEPKKTKDKASKKKSLKSAPVVFSYPDRRPKKNPIWIGEKHWFDITYLGLLAGEFNFEILPFKYVGRRKVYHIFGHAISSKVFSLFYKINDTVESFLDYEGLFSHRFHLVLDESKQNRDALELYDSEKAQTFYWNRWDHKQRGYTENKEFNAIAPFSQDSVSSLFYVRTLPLPDGAVITFPVVSEGKSWEAQVTVVRREVIDSPMGKVKTIVIKPETKFQGILQKRGDSFIWLTDDDRRFVVRVEARVKIGSVFGTLKKIEPGTPPPVESNENTPSPAAAPSDSS